LSQSLLRKLLPDWAMRMRLLLSGSWASWSQCTGVVKLSSVCAASLLERDWYRP
jgi:hypothetical protein